MKILFALAAGLLLAGCSALKLARDLGPYI